MDNLLFLKEFKSLEHLNCKSSDETQRDTLEIVVSNELIEIDAEKFEGDYQMMSENLIILNTNNVVRIIWILITKMQQDF